VRVEQHHYISTACQHGIHTRCARTCKFCDAPCRCGCDHDERDDEELHEALARFLWENDAWNDLTSHPRELADQIVGFLCRIPPSCR
jgi:hypothetical protein